MALVADEWCLHHRDAHTTPALAIQPTLGFKCGAAPSHGAWAACTPLGDLSWGRRLPACTCGCVCQSEPLLLVGVYATQARALAPHGTKDACNSVTTPSPLPISPSSPSLSPMACHPVHASAGPVHRRTLRHTKSETALARPRGIRLHCVVRLTSLWYV